MIICISGYTGSGKTTLGDALAKKMGIKHVGISHKTQFVSNPSDTLEFTKRNTSASFEKSFDELVVEEAHKQDCVVTSWLSPWFIKDASVRVWQKSLGPLCLAGSKRTRSSTILAMQAKFLYLLTMV